MSLFMYLFGRVCPVTEYSVPHTVVERSSETLGPRFSSLRTSSDRLRVLIVEGA